MSPKIPENLGRAHRPIARVWGMCPKKEATKTNATVRHHPMHFKTHPRAEITTKGLNMNKYYAKKDIFVSRADGMLAQEVGTGKKKE